MRLCSACLLGVKCRYNAESKLSKKAMELLEKEVLIPICPEQLGGLPTPREPSEIIGDGFRVIDGEGKVVTRSGRDVTRNFIRGAEEVLKLAKLLNVKGAVLKQNSPSCGSGRIYDGTFSGKLIEGDGVTAALLRRNSFKVMSEEDLR